MITIKPSQTRHVSGTDLSTGDPEAGLLRMCLESCANLKQCRDWSERDVR
jgi:hypothetical protein